MDSSFKLVRWPFLRRSVVCLVLMGFITGAHAQGLGLPPIVTPPIVLPIVLSLDGSVTNGGIAIVNATVTSLTKLKGMGWYCGGQPVPAAKSTVSNVSVIGVGTISTLTITGVALTNAGAYSLHATNTVGTTISSSVNMLVENIINNTVNVVDFVAGASSMTLDGFKIQLSGPTGSNVVVQASSDLKTWTSISTNLVSGGGASFTDTAAKTRSSRYYRAFIQ
jgi:hypothetical protein